MPIRVPNLDDRRYQDLVNEALARIPVHTPEWTNFGQGDPGVTLVELFAFLTETLLYRANQIPERNHKKFLELLGLPLSPGASARGIVQIRNERGPLETAVVPSGFQLRAGAVPFRVELGLDLLPVEGRVYYKRRLERSADELEALQRYYNQLYAAYLLPVGDASELELYETVPMGGERPFGFADAIDGSLWLALLARPGDDVEAARSALAGKTLSLGIVPAFDETRRELLPAGRAASDLVPRLSYEVPKPTAAPADASAREATYAPVPARGDDNLWWSPGVVQLSLPSPLLDFTGLEPHEVGAKDFPPALDDTKLQARVVTWLRIRAVQATDSKLLWVGINAAMVSQRDSVRGEALPRGTGAPDQECTLSRTPVIPGSVKLRVVERGTATLWSEISDLHRAGAEVPSEDPRQPPGLSVAPKRPVDVFLLDPESGRIRFGDGQRGRRPPAGATIFADYDYGMGARGNVAALAIDKGSALPAGVAVSNPVRTWGGAAPETPSEGEKQITRFLQHGDRAVSASDFKQLVRRTPGIQLGRVDVLSAYSPDLASNEAGDAAGAVTLLVLPRESQLRPDAPEPDRPFLDAICRYLEPRRLLTTEVFLRGPSYKNLWISVGIDVTAGRSIAEVEQAVQGALRSFLSPLPSATLADEDDEPLPKPEGYVEGRKGWPLKKPVLALELQARASRVDGVALVNRVLLADDSGSSTERIDMRGLELPRIAGLSVTSGEPVPLEQLRGGPVSPASGVAKRVPIPIIPENC